MSTWPFNNEEPLSDSQHDESSQSDPKKVVPFAVRACDFCKKRKIRCEGTIPCTACQRRGQTCTFTREQSKRGPKPKRVRRSEHAASQRGESASASNELISLQPLTQDLSKLKVELEIQKRLEAHWKQQYFELLQQQQSSTALALSTTNVPAYLRSVFVENNTTGLVLDADTASPLIGQFSNGSWGLIRDPDTPLKLQTVFYDGHMCHLPSYKMLLPIDEPVNTLIWKVLANNTADSITDFLRHETTPLVMQFMQSAVIFAQGLRALDEEQQHLDVGNHLLLVINSAFNILVYQREVQYNIKYVKQITYELLNLAQFLKYTGTGAAAKQLSPLLIQIVQQFESALDEPDLLANAFSHLLNKADNESEHDYWMAKLNGVPVTSPITKALRDFTVVISGLRIISPQTHSPHLLHEYLARIDAAQQVLSEMSESDPKNQDQYKFFAIWAHMSRAEVFYRLNEIHQHEIALKETMRRYFALPRNMLRQALRGLASVITSEGANIITASKLLQLTNENFDPQELPRELSLMVQQASSIVELHSSSEEVNSDVVALSPHDSHESNETFEDFIFDPIEQMTSAM